MDVNKTTKLYHHFLQEKLIYKPVHVYHRPIKPIKVSQTIYHNIIKPNKIGTQPSNENITTSTTSKESELDATPKIKKGAYSPGELVLSHMKGYPWWPSMISTCPSLNVSYNCCRYFVLFLDGKKNDTAWLYTTEVKTFDDYENYLKQKKKGTRPALLARMRKANKCAQEIKQWTNEQRLQYFVEQNHSMEDLCQTLMLPSKVQVIPIEASEPNLVPQPMKNDISSLGNVKSRKTRKGIRKRWGKKTLRHNKKKNINKLGGGEELKANTNPSSIVPAQHNQGDKDAISIEEDNDIVSMVNELINDLYS